MRETGAPVSAKSWRCFLIAVANAADNNTATAVDVAFNMAVEGH
jgi:hypothetical protein